MDLKQKMFLKTLKKLLSMEKLSTKIFLAKTGKVKSLLSMTVEKVLKHLKLGTLMETIQSYSKQMTVAKAKHILLVIR